MFLKLQVDANSFHILCSSKIPLPKTGVSFSPIEKVHPVNKSRERSLLENPRREKRVGRVGKQSHLRSSVDVHESRLNKHRFERNSDRERRKSEITGTKFVDKKSTSVDNCRYNGHGLLQDVHTKCSTKWLRYGGCIPAIIHALEKINDLDEALRPWAEKLSNKEITIILNEQSSWERALEIFNWFKRTDCYELNIIHYNIMFRILGRKGKWSCVKSIWDEMNLKGIVPTNSTYGTLIDVYNKGGLRKEALCWVGRMNKQGMQPDEFTMGIIVQMFKMAGEFQKAEEFFKSWSLNHLGTITIQNNNAVRLNCHTYNILIDAYGKTGQLKEASETFSRMLNEGVTPTTVTFNTMIHICGNNGYLEEVSSLMKKMEELRCPPDTRTYNILISLHAKHDNINMALSYFTKMKEACLQPDLVSYRTLLYAFSMRRMVVDAEDLVKEMDEKSLEICEYTQSALTRMYIEAGMLEKSWLWFSRFHIMGTMSSDGYSANIDAYGERGHIMEAEKVFICCQDRNKLTVLEFNVMIKAYGISKNYTKACSLFDSMENYGVIPDKWSYNSLVQILSSADMPQEARPYLRKMMDAGVVSDCIPYCAVISSFVRKGQLERAEEVYNEMIECLVEPDIIVYGVLVNAFADIGSVREALSYVESMQNAGLCGNAVIYNSLLKLYTKVGYLKEAEDMYKMLKSLEVQPDVYSSNCMIDLYRERSMVRQAEEIFEYLKKTHQANEFTFAMMLCMYKRDGRFEEATRIVKEMREMTLLTDLLSYNNVLDLYTLDEKFMEAVETFKEMINAGIQPDACTFKSLGSVLVKCGVSRKAVQKLEATRMNDAQMGLQAWLSILYSVVGMVDKNCHFR